MKLNLIAIAALSFIAFGDVHAQTKTATSSENSSTICNNLDSTQCQQQGQGQNQSINGTTTTSQGGNGYSSALAGTSATGGASVTTGASSNYGLAVSAATAARLPAVNCPSKSRAVGLGWNFVSYGASDVDPDGVCFALSMAESLYAKCQVKSALTMVYHAVNKRYEGLSLAVPSDAVDAVGGMCAKPASQTLIDTSKPEAKPQRISLSAGALFSYDRAELTLAGRQELASVAAKIAAAKPERIVITGHTDGSGSHVYNDALSRRRAEAVRSYLSMHGVTASMQVDGRGKREPVADNASESGRAANRRVTVDFVGIAQ